MKLWAFCLLQAVLPCLAQQPPAAKLSEKCKVSGVVLKAGTNEPILRARVVLWDEDERKDTQPATTDAQGRFEIKDLEPGAYALPTFPSY
jgi:hypothetical protein